MNFWSGNIHPSQSSKPSFRGEKSPQLPGAAGGSGSSGVLATRNSGPLGSKLTPPLLLASARMMIRFPLFMGFDFTIFRCLKALGFHLSTVFSAVFSDMNSNFINHGCIYLRWLACGISEASTVVFTGGFPSWKFTKIFRDSVMMAGTCQRQISPWICLYSWCFFLF